MTKPESDVISSKTLKSGKHYYSEAKHLQQKHNLAGDKFVRWVLDHIISWEGKFILDVGGGWGRFLWSLIDHYQVKVEHTVLTDLSNGMLLGAMEEASSRKRDLQTSVCDIQHLPFGSNQFDVVMANKVLYHLKDINQGVAEIARILKSNGTFLASTNSDKITATIIDLHYRALDKLDIPYTPEPPSSFSMENGAAYLTKHFQRVETFYFEEETLIHDAADIRATYESIGRYRNLLNQDKCAKALPDVVEELAQNILKRDGVIKSPILMGVFVCLKSHR